MAEVLAVAGGIASFAQILAVVVNTVQVVTTFCHDFQDVPSELFCIRSKLGILRNSLEEFRFFLLDLPDDDVFLLDMRQLLWEAVSRIQADIIAVQSLTLTRSRTNPKSVRRRLMWALLDKRSMQRILQHLTNSENTLISVSQLVNFRYTALMYQAMRKSNNTNAAITPKGDPAPAPTSTSTSNRWYITLGVDSVPRWLGFYGYFAFTTSTNAWISRLCFGYCPPAWLCSKSVALELGLSNLATGDSGIQFLPGHIRLQNRVALDSPFMTACQRGDVSSIRQHLADRTGSVGDRTTCYGKTPLLLAIEGEHLHAIQCLLEAGAAPNIGDDDQTLPVFAVAGLRPRRNRHFPQLPPTWELWVEALQILVKYGASVHELAQDRPIGTFNVVRSDYRPRTVEFFRLLTSENYQDFDTTFGKQSFSALLTAIRSKTHSVEALKVLRQSGVDLARITDDGRSPIHLAAEMAHGNEALEYLCSAGGIGDINRQDKWGWTPLHYSVISEFHGYCTTPFQKVHYLLEQGANTDIKGGYMPFVMDRVPSVDFTPLELSAILRPSLFSGFVMAMKRAGRPILSEWEEELFQDALDTQLA